MKWARWALENASTRRQVAGATGCSDVDSVLKAGKFKLEMLRARGKLPTSSKQMSLALIGVHRMGNFSIITKMMFKGKSNSGTNNFHCIGSIHKWSSGWLVFFDFWNLQVFFDSANVHLDLNFFIFWHNTYFPSNGVYGFTLLIGLELWRNTNCTMF